MTFGNGKSDAKPVMDHGADRRFAAAMGRRQNRGRDRRRAGRRVPLRGARDDFPAAARHRSRQRQSSPPKAGRRRRRFRHRGVTGASGKIRTRVRCRRGGAGRSACSIWTTTVPLAARTIGRQELSVLRRTGRRSLGRRSVLRAAHGPRLSDSAARRVGQNQQHDQHQRNVQ